MKKIVSLFLLITLLFSSVELSARAGGGGKSRSSSSSSGSSFSSRSFSGSSRSSGGSLPLWAIFAIGGVGVVVLIIYLMNKKKIDKAINNVQNTMNFDSESEELSKIDEIQPDAAFLAANPDFNMEDFKGKVRVAFPAIQEAWTNKNLSKVRKWISDGVYQRFHIQFEMMKKLGQTNVVSNVKITDIRLAQANVQNDFSIITVAIYFTMDDKFVSEKIKGIDEEMDNSEAMEYWSFVKKSGASKGDLFRSDNCPNCGDKLNEDGGEVSKCGSCGTVTYLGDYDWVLSEITQEEDYMESYESNGPALLDVLKTDHLCIQSMEDKVSNAFVHYLLTLASADAKYFARFATEDLLEKIKPTLKDVFVYNRVYINSVDYQTFYTDQQYNYVMVMVKYSAQRVKLNENKVDFIDDEVTSHYTTLTLSKKVGAELSKAKIWSHDCPSCGAPYADTSALSCSYCSAKINSNDKEWIISAIS